MKFATSLLLLPCAVLTGCAESEPAARSPVETPAEAAGATSSETPKPFGGEPQVIPGLVEAEHYDLGAAEVAYHDVEPENLGANYREPTGVDIEQRDDASNGHGLGWTRTGEWVCYTVHVLEAGAYDIEIPVASNKPGGVFHLEIDGTDITGPIEVPDTGGWNILQTITAQTRRLEAGQHVMKLVLDRQGESGSIGDIDYLRFTRVSPEDQSPN